MPYRRFINPVESMSGIAILKHLMNGNVAGEKTLRTENMNSSPASSQMNTSEFLQNAINQLHFYTLNSCIAIVNNMWPN